MQIKTLSGIKYLVGFDSILTDSENIPVLPCFSDEAVSFLNELSRELLGLKDIRKHQDIMSYAYWIRKASLEKERQKTADFDSRLGRGLAFHIAPSNVPVNFAVSMTSSLLAGNITVIRVANKEFEEVDIICNAINNILSKSEYKTMRDHICIIRYDHSDDITSYLSSICDLRVIWGGDSTINEIRRFPIPARAIEMCFADRYSMAVINAEKYLEMVEDQNDDARIIARKFYTDTYYSDQNACSSPRIVVWLNDNCDKKKLEQAQNEFWEYVKDEVDVRYELKPIQAVDKLSNFTELSMKTDGVRLHRINNKLLIIDVENADKNIMYYKTGGGFFFQYVCDSLDGIIPFLGKSCQTVAVLGIDTNEVTDLVRDNGVRGVDRVVELGDTMGLEFVWDGFKMIESMSRIVYTYER